MFARARARDSQLSALDSATASVLMQDLTHELPSTETDDASAPSVRPRAAAPSKPSVRRAAGPRRADRANVATRVGSRRSFERSAGSMHASAAARDEESLSGGASGADAWNSRLERLLNDTVHAGGGDAREPPSQQPPWAGQLGSAVDALETRGRVHRVASRDSSST